MPSVTAQQILAKELQRLLSDDPRRKVVVGNQGSYDVGCDESEMGVMCDAPETILDLQTTESGREPCRTNRLQRSDRNRGSDRGKQD